MNASRKGCLLAVANVLSWPWRLLPASWREGILTGLFVLDSRGEPRSIATRVAGSEVVGVDRDDGRLAEARAADNPDNLSFVKTDVCDSLPDGPWQAVVLSNVLEHIEDRVSFLKAILQNAKPERVLIRVPHFERDWKMPMRKELGLNYFSDAEHFIEHRLDELQTELAEAGLRPMVTHTLWGEIWMCCECIESDGQ